MNIGLVLIGDELLSGKRQDKHLPWVARALDQRRLELSWVHMVGDDEDALVELFSRTMASDDLVFSCGGIGATPDDRTRQAAARAAGRKLVVHAEAKRLIEARYGEQAYPRRIHMAEFAEGADLVPNPVNQVSGFSIDHHYFVPGFPNMAHPMIEWVLDTKYAHLSPEHGAVEYGLRVHDVPESELVELMESLLSEFEGLRLSSLPDSANRRFIELSVRGVDSIAAAAYEKMHAILQERNIELTDLRRPVIQKGNTIIMIQEQRVALVTGGNRGIGLEVCRGLATAGYRVVCAGRDEANLRKVRKGFTAQNLAIDTIMLDVTDSNMIDIKHGENVDGNNFIGDWIRRKYGRLDVLVNNAGVVPDGSIQDDPVSILDTDKSAFELGFATHFYGPLGVTRGILPMMRDQNYGRIVNVSTGMARLSNMEAGWAAYRVSKVALNALTAILAKELKDTNILVNAASPGWVKTRMGGEQAELTPEQGAETILWLAQLEDGGPTGGFFANREATDW